MIRRSISAAGLRHRAARHALALPLAALLLAAGPTHAQSTPEWDYRADATGPAHWGQLDPSFEACAKGGLQSPIDIRRAVFANLPALDVGYSTVAPTFINNGHTVQVAVPPGQTLTVGDQRYELLQFHFHTPSEEAINGKRTAMVAHFVHRSADGQLGVIAALIRPGRTNAAFAPVFAHLPRPGEKITVDGLTLDLAALLPAAKGNYAYGGSLTTPPCSEGVNWMVLKQPIELGREQIAAFRRLFNANARPLQASNGRLIQQSM